MDVPSNGIGMERFQNHLDSIITLFYFGDIPNFEAGRDTLLADLSSYIAAHPWAVNDPAYVRIRERLLHLDSLVTSQEYLHPYLAKMDSLALSFESWPDDDLTQYKRQIEWQYDANFPFIENRRIGFWIRYFTGPGKRSFERALYRMELYRPAIEDILRELELPRDLICLALIESGFNLKARSRARAVGPWQFIRGTARLYGLRVNWWLDERRDIIASTYAAGNYLKDLYSIWDSWFLAMAAYNAGEYRIVRAVARQRTTDFWKLRLPKQTERYVPKFLAALYISREPEKYGFKVPRVEPIPFDLIRMKDATDLKLIAKSAGTSVELIRDLNPAILRWCTPPRAEVLVKVPMGSRQSCEEALASIPHEKRVTWRRHRVRRGETLSVIARKYGTTISALKHLNHIRNSHLIRVGQTLIVPMKGAYMEVAGTKPAYKSKHREIDKEALKRYAKRSGPPAGYKEMIYAVRDNDTLGEIAELFHTSAKNLRRWNNLSYRSFIHPGQRLIVYAPESFDSSKLPPIQPIRPNEREYMKIRYVVKRGDTLSSISKRLDVRVSDLLAWNGKSLKALIRPGEVLEIWKKR